jgi:hypothetical protein
LPLLPEFREVINRDIKIKSKFIKFNYIYLTKKIRYAHL